MTRFSLVALAAFGISAAAAQAQPLESYLPADSATDPAKVELGRSLFFDPRLSGDSSTSCGDCHDPNYGFGDGAELSRGYPGTKHWRNSQTLVNSAFLQNGLHWDGSVPSFLHQVPGAMSTPFAANIDVVMAEERLKQIPQYLAQFQQIWGQEPKIELVAEAIASYENSLISIDSPYDRFIAGDAQALSQDAQRGYLLFLGKAGCVDCHSGSLMTDEKFHNTSVPANPEFLADPLVQISFRHSMRSLGVDQAMYEAFDRDPGYYAITMDTSDLGAFRTPPLRYLKYTAPYMHNGMLYTLSEVVDFYDQGGTQDAFGTKSDKIVPLGLTPQEKTDLVAFLESLSGTEIVESFPALPDYEAMSPSAAASVASVESVATETGVTSVSLDLQISPQGATQAAPQASGISAGTGGLVIGGVNGGQELVADPSVRTVVVAAGETLGDIAKREYGDVLRFADIIAANSDLITDPNNLTPGIRLVLP